jgi:predicted N-acetyltransferase YhbS
MDMTPTHSVHAAGQPANVVNRALVAADLPAVSALHAAAFGPGRFARTAYRVREGTPDISPFCRGAFVGGELIACLRLTVVSIGGRSPHLLLGPLAVAKAYAGQGFGKALVSECLVDAGKAGIGVVVLVGDLAYYGRFGFALVPPGQILFPGPVDPHRILAAETTPGALATARGTVVAV